MEDNDSPKRDDKSEDRPVDFKDNQVDRAVELTSDPGVDSVGESSDNTFYQEEDDPRKSPQPNAAKPEVQWRASEYIYHEKSARWFIILALIVGVSIAAALWFGQLSFAGLILVVGISIAFFANRKPREIYYQINKDGVTVDKKTFPFLNFRSFGVMSEGAFYSVELRPVKKFMPGVSIIFAEEDGEKIFDSLVARLPAEEINPDVIERFQRWLRF